MESLLRLCCGVGQLVLQESAHLRYGPSERGFCPLCFDYFNDFSKVVVLQCRHVHCQSCTLKMIEDKRCPMCRAPISYNPRRWRVDLRRALVEAKRPASPPELATRSAEVELVPLPTAGHGTSEGGGVSGASEIAGASSESRAGGGASTEIEELDELDLEQG
ncbi:43kDa postsynaptic protein [Trema orientale]|uniref:43kDa postsynaptic protein n=1 Tax=Trema orientale TaxID=63057 RepID=A0A2P5BC42_TREOI|nr:43kDa postsynaptic protein [Trema orientale]